MHIFNGCFFVSRIVAYMLGIRLGKICVHIANIIEEMTVGCLIFYIFK